MSRDNLKLVKEFGKFLREDKYETIKIVDDNNFIQGELIAFKNGFFWYRAFCKNNCFIGEVVDYNKVGEIESRNFYSLRNEGKKISENEYKKELVMLRLGLIEIPQLSIYLKDFGYEE